MKTKLKASKETLDFLDVLQENNFYRVRQNSSHVIYKRDSDGSTFPITTNLNRCIARKLIKENNLTGKYTEKYLRRYQ